MPRVDEKMSSKKHDHSKAHATNTKRNRRKIREMKRSWND